MNAKQLRRAAELLHKRDEQIRSMFREAAKGLDGHLADHILSTVREDDDEPFSQEWATRFNEAKLGSVEISTTPAACLDIANDGTVCLNIDNAAMQVAIETRGEFRTLCRLLGVKLKEDE